MIYRFEAGISAPKGKLTREDKAEIRDYLSEVRIEADGPDKACRLLARRLSGRLSKDSQNGEAVIALPDYGTGCQVRVTAYAAD